MKDCIIITIPQFIEEVQLSQKRRKKYFQSKDKIPSKYADKERYVFKKSGKFTYLYDIEEKDFVLKNPISAGSPSKMRISGNEIYARMHERKRMAIVKAIKDNMRPYLPKKIDLKFPIHIDIDLYTTPKFCNWDLDNLWIYNKCFQDLLVDEGLIPEDNIMYITKPGAPRYIPVVNDDDRKMEFIIYEDKDLRIVNHIMFSLDEKKDFAYLVKEEINTRPSKFYQIKRSTDGALGDLIIDQYSGSFFIQIGKRKIIYGALIKALGRVYSQCIQLNCFPYVSEEFFQKHKEILKKELCDKGIPVFIVKEGSF